MALPAYAVDVAVDANVNVNNGANASTRANVSGRERVEVVKERVQEMREEIKERIFDGDEIRIGLRPQVQRAPLGQEAAFVIIVSDTANTCEETCEFDISVEGDVESRIESENISVELGEVEEVVVYIKSDVEGTHRFSVSVGEKELPGILYVSDEAVDLAFFNGKGYAVSEDGEGVLLNLNLVKDSDDVKGRLHVGNRLFSVSGVVLDGEADLTLEGVNSNASGEMDLEVERFNAFIVVKGEMEIEGKTFDVNIVSTHGAAVREVQLNQRTRTQVNEVLEVDSDTYINPVRVQPRRLLGFIPWGKEVVVEVSENGSVQEHRIRANQNARIQGYVVSVGDLESDAEVEIEVEEE